MSFTKTPLEKRRAVFFQTGLMAALAFALAAFTWTTPEYGYRTNLADLRCKLGEQGRQVKMAIGGLL